MQNIELRYIPLGVSSEGGQEVRLDDLRRHLMFTKGEEFNLEITIGQQYQNRRAAACSLKTDR